jgi:hypothetical protein
MFLIDDLMLTPAKGLLAICRRVQQTAREQFEKQQQTIVADLSELHRLADSEQIAQDQFNARESDLLDRLEKIQNMLDKLKDEG